MMILQNGHPVRVEFFNKIGVDDSGENTLSLVKLKAGVPQSKYAYTCRVFSKAGANILFSFKGMVTITNLRWKGNALTISGTIYTSNL